MNHKDYAVRIEYDERHLRHGICRLCRKKGELCESHALPHSQFNYVLRKSDGKAIVVTDDELTPVQYTPVLCSWRHTKMF